MAITTDRDRVRLLIGDTDANDPLFQDDEIAYFLEQAGTVLKACVLACRAAAAKYARDIKFKTDDQEFDPSKRAEQWRAMAAEFARQANGGVTSTALTRTDGFSQDVASDAVSAGGAGAGRRNFYTSRDRVF